MTENTTMTTRRCRPTLHIAGTRPIWRGWQFEVGKLHRFETTDGHIKFHAYSWELDGLQVENLAWTTGHTVDLSLTAEESP